MRLGALCVLVLCTLAPGSLRAAQAEGRPRPRLVVHREPEASDCPDAPSLAVAVERMMQRPALDPVSAPVSDDGVPPELEVRIHRDGPRYTAVLQAGGRARRLSSEQAPTCDELADALALTIAILLDSEPAPMPELAPPPPAPPPPAPPPPAPPPPAPPPPAPLPAPVAPVQRATPAPAPSRVAPPRWDLEAELGAAQTVGMLDAFRAAVLADVSLRRGVWSAGLGAVWLPQRGITFLSGVAITQLAATTLRGCVTVAGRRDGPRLSTCAASLLGAVHGAGEGFPVNREEAVPWFAVGGAALAEGPLHGPLGWSARATLLVPVTRARFTVERGDRTGSGEMPATDAPGTSDVVLDSAPVGLLVGVGARLSIW
ncbi:hypothetical protein SOCEGT47_047160 [Sorangium cellulosum]|uniref:Secreted protein n=1 Tax=Sorangium cellulosum TaxID=56 RepID=A0A4P2Q4C7_SORCE|nr:hypothetical protein SOCEGT47_047160 [Sorangium cellulosum]